MSQRLTARESTDFVSRKRRRFRRRVVSDCEDCALWQMEQRLGNFWTVTDSYSFDKVDDVSGWSSVKPYGGLMLSAKGLSPPAAKTEVRELHKNRPEKVINFRDVSAFGLPVPISLKSSTMVDADYLREPADLSFRKAFTQLPYHPANAWKEGTPTKLSVDLLIASLNTERSPRLDSDSSRLDPTTNVKGKLLRNRLARFPLVPPSSRLPELSMTETSIKLPEQSGGTTSDNLFPYNLLKNPRTRGGEVKTSEALMLKFPITDDDVRRVNLATRKASALYNSKRSAGMRRLVLANRATTLPRANKPDAKNVYYLRYSNGVS